MGVPQNHPMFEGFSIKKKKTSSCWGPPHWNSARLTEQKGGLAEDAMLLFAAEVPAALPRPGEARELSFLGSFNISMKNHNFQWLDLLYMAFFNSYIYLFACGNLILGES